MPYRPVGHSRPTRPEGERKMPGRCNDSLCYGENANVSSSFSLPVELVCSSRQPGSQTKHEQREKVRGSWMHAIPSRRTRCPTRPEGERKMPGRCNDRLYCREDARSPAVFPCLCNWCVTDHYANVTKVACREKKRQPGQAASRATRSPTHPTRPNESNRHKKRQSQQPAQHPRGRPPSPRIPTGCIV